MTPMKEPQEGWETPQFWASLEAALPRRCVALSTKNIQDPPLKKVGWRDEQDSMAEGQPENLHILVSRLVIFRQD